MSKAKKRYPNPGPPTGFKPWHPHYKVEKYNNGILGREPDEVIEWDGNVMQNDGINLMLDLLIAPAGGSDFDAGNGYLGVGNSAASSGDATLTDLVGASKERVVIDAQADLTAHVLTFIATFGSAAGNFAWEEVGIFNSAAAGVMLTRSVSALGTKTTGATWVLKITLAIFLGP